MPNMKPFKAPPPEIKKLLQKFNNNRSAAGRAIGYSDSTTLNLLGHRKVALTDELKSRIERVLAGETLPDAVPKRRSGKSAARSALILASVSAFTRLYPLGEGMDGIWKFKTKVAKGWLGIITMRDADLEDFLVIAKKKGAEIVAL